MNMFTMSIPLWAIFALGWLAITQQPTRIMFDPATDGPIRVERRPDYLVVPASSGSGSTSSTFYLLCNH